MRPGIVSRYRHDKFSDWSYPVQCCVWLAALAGPAMLVFGIVLLVVAVRDPATGSTKAYNRAVQAWTQAGGGFELWKEAFDGPYLPAVLTAVSANGSQALATTTFELEALTGTALLAGQGYGYETYDEALYYSAALPIGLANLTDQHWQIATLYEPRAPQAFTSYSCASVVVTEPCDLIAPPPPPKAPPLPRAAASAAYVYTGPGSNSSAAAAGGAAVWTPQMWGRKLAAAAPAPAGAPAAPGGMCTVWYRQIEFLKTLTLVASPPDSCGGGYCANSTWSYSLAPSCSSQLAPSTIAIDEATFEEDVADGFAWCADWTTYFAPPKATVVLRSSSDPVVIAGGLTNCTFDFATASLGYANAGFFFIVPGMALALAAFFCLEGMCTPRSLSGLFGAPSAIDVAEAGGIVEPKSKGLGPMYGAADAEPAPVELSRAGGAGKWAAT